MNRKEQTRRNSEITSMSVNDCLAAINQMASACTIKNHNRAVFLTLDGKPKQPARAIGERLYKLGCVSVMQYACQQLRMVSNYQNSDDRELEVCWHGIGEWGS